jgi:hypothetical protein
VLDLAPRSDRLMLPSWRPNRRHMIHVPPAITGRGSARSGKVWVRHSAAT